MSQYEGRYNVLCCPVNCFLVAIYNCGEYVYFFVLTSYGIYMSSQKFQNLSYGHSILFTATDFLLLISFLQDLSTSQLQVCTDPKTLLSKLLKVLLISKFSKNSNYYNVNMSNISATSKHSVFSFSLYLVSFIPLKTQLLFQIYIAYLMTFLWR